MDHRDGYCDVCGEPSSVMWLSFEGVERCADCARGTMVDQVRVAAKPEARDDGR